MQAMKALLRTLLLWCLLAGVPLQGFATATMLLCGPDGAAGLPAVAPHRVAQQAPQQASQQASHHAPHHAAHQAAAALHADGHHDHAAMLAAQRGHAASGGDDGDSGAAVLPDPAHADTSHADHVKCASAGACCAGAPLAPSPPAAPALQEGRCATVPFVAAAPAAVDLAGIERPPKFPPA